MEIGGWGAGDPTGKSISVSVRACVRAVVVRWESAENVVRAISLFLFIPGSFPFSLLASGAFPFSLPLPPTSYPASAGFIGMGGHMVFARVFK